MGDFKKIETSGAPKAIGPYSQAVCAPPYLFVSGQLALDPLTGKSKHSTSASSQPSIRQPRRNL